MATYECYCGKCDVPDNKKYPNEKKSIFTNIYVKAIHDKKYDCVNNLCKETCYNLQNGLANDLASLGDIDGLKFLHDKKIKFGSSVMTSAIDKDDLECVKYLHSQKCKWTTASTKYASKFGKIKTLTYMVEQGCPCNEEACYWYFVNARLFSIYSK